MKIKITMVNGNIFEFENQRFNNLLEFIDGQLNKRYYILSKEMDTAIVVDNILKIEDMK